MLHIFSQTAEEQSYHFFTGTADGLEYPEVPKRVKREGVCGEGGGGGVEEGGGSEEEEEEGERERESDVSTRRVAHDTAPSAHVCRQVRCSPVNRV